MSRPILSLWPYLWRIGHLCRPWLWRLAKHVRRFCTASDGRVVLHYAPELDSKWNMPTLLQRCHEELDRLTDRFGFPLRGRTVVFLFASYEELGNIFGKPIGGLALRFANAILIADDQNVRESMRHEFAHLYSARWNVLAPPLLSEGLPVWLQETFSGQPIDKVVRPLLDVRRFKLSLLLKSSFFFTDPQRRACYAMAGSFTGFLVRRYGWERFRKLFRRCNRNRFPARFKKYIGVTLEKAEWQWRSEIMVMDVLNRRLRRKHCY